MTRITKIEVSNLKNSQKKIRVAAYARVSTNTEEQLLSLATQKEHYEREIMSHSSWEYAGLYYDEGISGTKIEKRDGLLKLLDDCENGRIDRVITKSISRFSRNTVDCLEMVRKLTGMGVYLYFEKENIDTEHMSSELKSGDYIAWACINHIRDKKSCKMKQVREENIHAALIQMMNKLIAGKSSMMIPFIDGLRGTNDKNRLDRVLELEAKLEKLKEEANVLNQLFTSGYIEPEAFFSENKNLEYESDCLEKEKNELTSEINGDLTHLNEAKKTT
ncbi:recombinase family protein [Streptococcus suis]|uniref:recombinase family protein n=1 Tax=Streptococcus suis TaxID=1307 RepID=UPI001FC9F9EB|nr:recombinase family protein [Streptococcus suis]MDG3135106.1 recombinase family protein [Streptococcus suis]